MIWLVGKDLNQYRPIVQSFYGNKIQSKEYDNLSEAFKLIDQNPSAILIDIDGVEAISLEFCWMATHSMNSKRTDVFIFSSSKDEFLEVSAFKAGAADFIVKPFSNEVVISRINARIGNQPQKNILRKSLNGDTILEINKDEFSVTYRNNEVLLSRKEFELLFVLAGNPGKVFSREELYRKVWEDEYDPKDRTIDVHILRIRKKLDDDVILTIKGVGYRFNIKH